MERSEDILCNMKTELLIKEIETSFSKADKNKIYRKPDSLVLELVRLGSHSQLSI